MNRPLLLQSGTVALKSLQFLSVFRSKKTVWFRT